MGAGGNRSELQVGGVFRIGIHRQSGALRISVHRRFLEVLQAARLVYSWGWDGAFAECPGPA